jgi:hypothetical protein
LNIQGYLFIGENAQICRPPEKNGYSLKIVISGLISAVLLFSMTGCVQNGMKKSPVGSYEFGSTSFRLDKEGTFWLEHLSSGNDLKHYTITGTYTYTMDHSDEENEISFGKMDIVITGLTLDGTAVQSLDFTTIHTGTDVSLGNKVPGWWKFMNRITYGGKMNLILNLPFRGFRSEDVYSGADWLVIGDPK